MSNDQNLTPDQRAIPAVVRRLAYIQVPRTCDTVREILDEMAHKISVVYTIPLEDHAALDAIISRGFLAIRDRVTQPLRTAQMQAINDKENINGKKQAADD